MIQQPTITLNNDVKMPMVGFGVFQIPAPDVCQKAVEEAVKTGCRLIDTTEAYDNEEAVGKTIKASGVPCEGLFITTKAFVQHINYEGAKEVFEELLRRLDTDYINLYLLHQPVGDTFGTWRTLEELYKNGKVHAIGVSNLEDNQLANLAIFDDVTPTVNQIKLHVFNQKNGSVAYQVSKGVQVESWDASVGGRFDVFNNSALKAIADKYGKTTVQVMFHQQLQRGIVSLSKSAKLERVRQSFDIFDFELSDDDMAQIKTLNTNTAVFADHHEVATFELLVGFVGRSF